jgi:hypothetical protein
MKEQDNLKQQKLDPERMLETCQRKGFLKDCWKPVKGKGFLKVPLPYDHPALPH